MKIFTGILILLTASFLSAQSPNFQWSYAIGGTQSDSPIDAGSDVQGNFYYAGSFGGTVDFDPGPGTFNLTSSGNSNIYVSKKDASGVFVWAVQIGSAAGQNCYSMKTDASGNIYLTGDFRGTVDFDPGVNSYTMATSASSVANGFILKLNAAGSFIWARQLGDPSLTNPTPRAITCDAGGNVYVTGEFSGTRDFDPGPLTFNLSSISPNTFVLKLDAAGNFVWCRQLGATQGLAIEVDQAGNVFSGGGFFGTGDFDPGSSTSNLVSYAGVDGFVSMLDASGNFVWAKQFGGTSNQYVTAIKADCEAGLAVGGFFAGTLKADPASSADTHTTLGGNDVFITKLDAAGNFIWAGQIGGTTTEFLNEMAGDLAGNLYLTGSFGGGVAAPGGALTDFDPGPGTYTLANAGANDAYFCRINTNGTLAWAYAIASTNGDAGYGVSVDNNFNVFFTGNFGDIADIDPTTATSAVSSSGSFDIYALKFSQQNPMVPVITSTTSAGSVSVCSGNSVSLSAAANGSITWYSSPSSTTSIGSGSFYTTPTLTISTVYYVESVRCSITSTRIAVNVSVEPLPVVTPTVSRPVFCKNEKITIGANGADTYLWSNANATSQFTLTAGSSFTLSVTGTGTNGCNGTATLAVVVNECLDLSSSGARQVLQFYPNPASTMVYCTSPYDTWLVVRDIQGKQLKYFDVSAHDKNALDLTGLKSGVYLFTDTSNNVFYKILLQATD